MLGLNLSIFRIFSVADGVPAGAVTWNATAATWNTATATWEP